ncbi:LacI family DNA-binding transcriptional regulator [Naasia sp. SYSU D00948]|uniref:LacI family DNA-binding transcriptional regulator n=1 Tax=Naasia sp. SYSU D00948 TaxID=2817379 RepID=UPI001B30FAC6|nr:LacI family DNA-binding transcriptional regulator [Naasia sp. SYSU D00948]
MADVARHAGVSLATVSRVMNGNPSVDPALADRVRAAVASLNYTASPLARSLVSGRTQTVSVVVPDLGNPTFQAILRGLSRAASRSGYHVLVADSAEVVEEEEVLAVASRRRTDGIVLCAPRMPEERLATLLPELAPVVLVNRDPRAGVPVVAADYRSGLTELLEHLAALGHRRILYLAGVPWSASNAHRLEAVEDFRRANPGARVDEVPCGVDFDAGAAVLDDVLASGATAVLAFNDLVAMGLLSALAASGVRVPEDVSVAGFDDIPFAAYTSPPLTTATVPAEELGEKAWLGMSGLIEARDAPESVYLRPRARIRGSTGPAPSAR